MSCKRRLGRLRVGGKAVLAMTTGLLVLVGATVPAAAETRGDTCGRMRITIKGTDGDDILVGTDGPDVIAGFGGDDLIIGRGGDDVLCGGDGDDWIEDGTGRDLMYGEVGVDVFYLTLDGEQDFAHGGKPGEPDDCLVERPHEKHELFGQAELERMVSCEFRSVQTIL